ncbi:hypothetical protein QRX60_30695 [Amycolatopsis mongoliensis]|uniref:YxiG-like domain-containing protein n=1 Tax=Amycolatopsis mongoliensis TaxID=715475 RepID=A0A9Y2NE82_9PSEU|nr:hypothetical protein [Amycolatopsis sp. 4-36]WIX98423.1 hypothetical protein QRX60_30695 [Amycolatopsis sp. 4-36]
MDVQQIHEALIETNSHSISLVFSDLSVGRVERGYSPFTVQDDQTEAGTL